MSAINPMVQNIIQSARSGFVPINIEQHKVILKNGVFYSFVTALGLFRSNGRISPTEKSQLFLMLEAELARQNPNLVLDPGVVEHIMMHSMTYAQFYEAVLDDIQYESSLLVDLNECL